VFFHIKSAATHGRGLFAAIDLEAGSLVIYEKVFCLPNRHDGETGSNLIMYNLNTTSRTQRLYNNPPHLNKSFFDIEGGNYIRSGKEGELVDGVLVVDM